MPPFSCTGPPGSSPRSTLRQDRKVGESAARQALQDHGCIIDLASLHLLRLLADDDQLLIRAALLGMITARSVVSGAILTRDKMRALGISTYTVALRHDDSIEGYPHPGPARGAPRPGSGSLARGPGRHHPSPSRGKAGCRCGATTWPCGSRPGTTGCWPSASWTWSPNSTARAPSRLAPGAVCREGPALVRCAVRTGQRKFPSISPV